MPYGIYISAEGANAQSKKLDTISNNLANVETVGFKRELAILQARQAEAISRGSGDAGPRSVGRPGRRRGISGNQDRFFRRAHEKHERAQPRGDRRRGVFSSQKRATKLFNPGGVTFRQCPGRIDYSARLCGAERDRASRGAESRGKNVPIQRPRRTRTKRKQSAKVGASSSRNRSSNSIKHGENLFRIRGRYRPIPDGQTPCRRRIFRSFGGEADAWK